jgi:hypothetical protein
MSRNAWINRPARGELQASHSPSTSIQRLWSLTRCPWLKTKRHQFEVPIACWFVGICSPALSLISTPSSCQNSWPMNSGLRMFSSRVHSRVSAKSNVQRSKPRLRQPRTFLTLDIVRAITTQGHCFGSIFGFVAIVGFECDALVVDLGEMHDVSRKSRHQRERGWCVEAHKQPRGKPSLWRTAIRARRASIPECP